MATYSDSLIGYADWQSSGRGFAAAAVIAAAVGGVALYASQEHAKWLVAGQADAFFGSLVGCVALGVAAIFALAVAGSLSITRRKLYTLEISERGVLWHVSKSDLFLARSEIIGMAKLPGRGPLRGGVALLTADPERRISLPATLAKYGACLDELRALGIPELPPLRRSRKRTLAAWLIRFSGLWALLVAIDRRSFPWFASRHAAIVACGIAVSALCAWCSWRVESKSPEVSQR